MDGEQELAHDGTEGRGLFEAPIVDEVVVVSPDVGVVTCGAESWHVKGQAQVAVAGLRVRLKTNLLIFNHKKSDFLMV